MARAGGPSLSWGTAMGGARVSSAPVSGVGEPDGAAEAGRERTEWVSRAGCRSGDPERLFVRGAAQREAASICRGCPVQLECLADALDHRVEFGVWGGLTERERRALLRERPDVTAWRPHLVAVRGGRPATRAG